ncbi:MAG: hypothetical protein KGY74_09060 [Candidatus Cloacimonetes bacterium]|nr:hypothetical protein [Candidatus Cloacimonadota bacterium]
MFLVKINGKYIKRIGISLKEIELTDKKHLAYQFSDKNHIKSIFDDRGFSDYEIEEIEMF